MQPEILQTQSWRYMTTAVVEPQQQTTISIQLSSYISRVQREGAKIVLNPCISGLFHICFDFHGSPFVESSFVDYLVSGDSIGALYRAINVLKLTYWCAKALKSS